jgi:hypothetical protein
MLHIVTYSTDEMRSKYLNCPKIINLGRGKTWNSYIDKINAMRTYLQVLPANDIVCFIDGFDVVSFLPKTETEIIDVFEQQQADILFSSETNCFPWSHVASLYPTSISLYKYLNSGGYMGYVWALRILLQYDTKNTPCDQGFFTYIFINYKHDKDMNTPIKKARIKLDSGCRIFQTCYGIPWSHFYVRNGRLYNRVERSSPFFLHFNGNYFLQRDGTSVMPIVWNLAQQSKNTDTLYEFPHPSNMRFSVICDEMGIPNGNVSGVEASSSVVIEDLKTPSIQSPDLLVTKPLSDCPRDPEIVEFAKKVAERFIIPNQDKIMARDQVSHHAIIRGARFVSDVTDKTMHREFALTNRRIIENYLGRIGSSNKLMLDIVLGDLINQHMNTTKWPHSVLGFSKDKNDLHNALLPDLYAMQNYKGMLDDNVADNLPTLKKMNKMLFIGTSSGLTNIEVNPRLRLCRFAKNRDWIEAYISSVVHFEPAQVEQFKDLMHDPISVVNQQTYRHILVVDGHTACWDRLAWVMASRCVCWKMESDDECWYYPFLKPWVHYIPFSIDNLEEFEATWNRVKDDRELQMRIVSNANTFVEEFLTPHAHALYTRTLLDEIANKYKGTQAVNPVTVQINYLESFNIDSMVVPEPSIIQLAKENAKQYVKPDHARILARDQENHHAILQGTTFVRPIQKMDFEGQWAHGNRKIIEEFFKWVNVRGTSYLDISLHDYVGYQSNSKEWPHSILGFSTKKSDHHNILIPDLYAMQDYKGSIQKDICQTKIQKLLFIGSTTGKASVQENQRIQLCLYAHNKPWIEAYISSVVNFNPPNIQHILHDPMTIQEQFRYQHLMVVDGNTACWDRLPWVLASKSVCWKMESDHQCWYYPFLKPWVHYIPFTLDNLEETWHRVKDDVELHKKIIANANQFFQTYLTRQAHGIYLYTLLNEIYANESVLK